MKDELQERATILENDSRGWFEEDEELAARLAEVRCSTKALVGCPPVARVRASCSETWGLRLAGRPSLFDVQTNEKGASPFRASNQSRTPKSFALCFELRYCRNQLLGAMMPAFCVAGRARPRRRFIPVFPFTTVALAGRLQQETRPAHGGEESWRGRRGRRQGGQVHRPRGRQLEHPSHGLRWLE